MTILKMSAEGAVLIAVVLVLRRCLLNRLPKWTFLLLWAVALCRLLVPFTLPSQLSVYTGAARIAQAVQEEEEPPADVQLPILTPPVTVPGTFREDSPVLPAVPVSPEPEREPVSPLAAVRLTGTALCGVFFVSVYLWTLRRFWDAVPAEAEFLTRWRAEHPTLRPVQVKTSGAVNAPVAYGLIRPVILLPENTDWTDEGQLTYILTHEYVHIRRGDLLWKLLLTAALCLHWFNPLVWVMYFRANRDLELACDEAVVRTLGLDSRKGYAYALLSAAESGFSPLCLTYTTKNHMEERIRAIMKMKKKSVAAILTAALLVAGVTAVFATSKAPEPKDISDLPPAVMTNTDPKPAPGDKSVPDDRVHPAAPADTSTPDVSRVHPITGQPAGTVADASQEPTIEKTTPEPAKASGHPVNNKGQTYGDSSIVSPDVNTPDLIEVPYIVDGKNVRGGVRCYVLKEDIMPYRYPGEINNPDDAMDYMAWMEKLPYNVTLPAYDQEGDSLGTTEVLLNYDAKGGRLTPAQTAGMDLETVREMVKNNRWGVPANPIPGGTRIPAADEQDMRDLILYLRLDRGYTGSLGFEKNNATGERAVLFPLASEDKYVAKEDVKVPKGLLSDGSYPVNSRGETYGSIAHEGFLGYWPDLIGVVATNGKSGYALKTDFDYFDIDDWAKRNHKTSSDYDEWLKLNEEYKAWAGTQPSIKEIPVYDVDRNNILGYYRIGNDFGYDYTISQEEIQERLDTIADHFRRVEGYSEEQIDQLLEEYKQSQGWS